MSAFEDERSGFNPFERISQFLGIIDQGAQGGMSQSAREHANQIVIEVLGTLLEDIHRIANAIEHLATPDEEPEIRQ